MISAREPAVSGLEAAHFPRITRPCMSVPETYTCFTMVEAVEGDVELVSRGVRAPCEPGAVTVGQNGEAWVLRARSEMRMNLRVVRLHDRLVDVLGEDTGVRGGASPFRRGPQRGPGLDGEFLRLHGAIDRGEPLEVEERLLSFLGSLLPSGRRMSPPTGARSGQAVRLAQEFLRARFAERVSLDELAGVSGSDRFALLRAFSRHVGITPHAYQMKLRMARARELIAQGMPLADVAAAVGYSEQSALTRAFKAVVGVTPGVYARAVR